MTRLGKYLLLGSLLAIHVLARSTHVSMTRSAVVGQTVPAVELTGLDGKPTRMDIDAAAGAPHVLVFWASWCAPCRQELQVLQELARRGDPLFRVTAINFREPVDLVREYVERNDMTLTVALDRSGEAARVLGVVGLPATVLVGVNGRSDWRSEGYRSDYPVQLERHVRLSWVLRNRLF